ncbi:MAG TPA: PIG-L deacetylase family protein [Intrasporangium sp.]|nr:PIG-L deacetylase family protein [Intrasporangium sp.]
MIGLGVPEGPLEVLCLGAHCDDIEIGCGGTLLQLAARSQTSVSGVILTGQGERANEARDAMDAFVPGAKVEIFGLPDGRLPAHWDDVKQALEDVATRSSPHIVLAPRVDDAHQDHRLVGSLARTVWRDALVLHYEIPKWDGDTGAPSHFVGLSQEEGRKKVELLNQCYPSQAGRDWWDDELFLGLMRIRGMESRHHYAEAFFAPKVLVDLRGQGNRA